MEFHVARQSLTALVAQVSVEGKRKTKFLWWVRCSWLRRPVVDFPQDVEPRESSSGLDVTPELIIKVVPNRVRLQLEKVYCPSYANEKVIERPSAGIKITERDLKFDWHRSLVEGGFFGQLGWHVSVTAAGREGGREENRSANCQNAHTAPPSKFWSVDKVPWR
jgi:hypothetical protein